MGEERVGGDYGGIELPLVAAYSKLPIPLGITTIRLSNSLLT
mgnify:FL=1